jgi:Ni/Fe-hydrogenase subunit HybB-like protein
MSTHEHAAPVGARFFTRGTIIVTAIMVLGLSVGLYRLVFGLASVSNLDDQYPFGLWKGLNVAAGIALGAAGFTKASWTSTQR